MVEQYQPKGPFSPSKSTWARTEPLLPPAREEGHLCAQGQSQCPAEMASAEPNAEDAAEAEEAVYEVLPCDRMELSQRLAVEELITTEASYVHNIQLCVSDIRAHLQKKQLPELDLEGLFSNTNDILHVSRRFLKGLEATAGSGQEQLLCISTLFQEFKEEMETVYKVYCASYDHALQLVESYRRDPRLQEEILDTLNATVPHTGASDLSFFLVMPVQRVTKYPLLLGKILENTPSSASAHSALEAAARAMAQVNANINEYKRRREVATKYNKAEHLTLRDRLARLNTHSIAKKTTRLSRLLMHEAGIVAKTEDKEYDDLEEKFQCVASSVATLKENMASYLGHLEAFLLPTPHQSDLQVDEGPAQQYRRLSERLQSAVFPEFVSAPSLHISISSPTSCRGTVGLAARSWGHPSVPTAPQSPAHLQSPTHEVREQLQGRRKGRDRDRTPAQLLSPPRAGMSCSVCLLGASGSWAAHRETGEETRTPQGRGRGPLNGLWAGETQLRLPTSRDRVGGPRQLVKKRLDKLLDYEEIQERKSEMGSVSYDEEAAMNTYLAINDLLVAELPQFNQVAVQLLEQILRSFSSLQLDLAAQVLHQAEKELEQLPHGHMPLPSFWKVVEDSLQQSGAQLRAFCQAFETVTPSPGAQPLTPAEERKVLSLVSKHGPDKLYQVTSNISGSKDLDLTLLRGQIVALLQGADTKGNTSRWLVDAGGPRGFVPAAKLRPYSPVQVQQPGMQLLTLDSGTERRRHSYASPEAPRPQVATFTPTFQVVAGFSFAARSPQEVTLQAGQPVVVLEPHDKKGSTEWSLVEVNGQRGYVPSSYLVTVPVQDPAGWSLPV
ncbi:PREDICTED: rho guanine nucleotide exchange factor 37 [Corvus brachyrhynchos]|uniref:rho guanine nucleotide exchange factor 37 n=1 Tax=Corvus brachyrhynchos TaxID=85066 RepID=UPI0008165861|nr:PREDICTED: rho guanine nucleotide exchange factor 37 [Corvus brachyrhynchos]